MATCVSRQQENTAIYCSKLLNKVSLEKILSEFSHKIIGVKEIKGLEDQDNEAVNDNFQSDIFRLTVTTLDDEVFHIVAKEALDYSNRVLRWIQSINRPFYKECLWYRVARPLLSTNWPLVNEFSPKCYYGEVNVGLSLKLPTSLKYFGILGFSFVSKSEKSLILLENVCERSGDEKFVCINKIEIIEFDIALSAIRTMANFHGIWWQFLHGGKGPREPYLEPKDFYNIFAPKLSGFGMKSFIARIALMITNLLRNNVENGEELANRYEIYSKTDKLRKIHEWLFVNPVSDNSRMKTMAHGDYWTNNLLYRPSDKFTVMIDYQVMQIAHPARDFWYFIYSCTDRHWRELYLDQCKATYYEIYSSYADENNRLTFEEVSQELDERRGFGIFVPFMTMMMTKYPEQINKQQVILFGKDYDRVIEVIGSKEKEEDHPNVKKMRCLYIEAVKEAADLGII